MALLWNSVDFTTVKKKSSWHAHEGAMVQGSAIACTALRMLEHVAASWAMNFPRVQPLKAALRAIGAD
jgi:hypothetical protein